MKKLLAATAIAMAGSAALAQTTSPTPPAPPAPMGQPVKDWITTRTEVVEKVREHFGKLDANKDGAVTKEEVMDGPMKSGEPMKAMRWKHAEGEAPHAMLDSPMGDPNAAFDRLDSNKDGSISREEFAAGRERRIDRRIVMREQRKDRARTPKEGKEVRRHVMRMHGRGPFGAHMIIMADTDKDGKVTQAEAEALALQRFDQMDANKDGQVTPEERRAGRQIMIERIEEKKGGS